MDKLLRLYTYVDGGANDTPFPNSDNPIEIGAFRYDAKRMGGAPTITASVNYASCLDDEWTYNVYAMFNGEKFYLKQIPTSSYNNTSAMYKHDIELVSERVALDNVYFFDVVSDDIVDDDKPVSNSTKVVFFGDVREFANRLKASLQYSALDYDVVVDADVVSEEKLVSFEDQFFSNVLQEIYNTYEVPYYFEGKTIHIGYSKPNEELPSFAYGVDDALLSISKNNANYKIVNRATGTGSSENIPYYYPNNSPKGNIRAELNTTSDDFSINVVDLPTFADKIDLDGDIEAKMVSLSVSRFMLNDEEYTLNHMPQEHVTVNYYQIFRDNVSFVAYSNSAVKGKCSFTIRIAQGDSSTGVDASKYMAKIHVGDKTLDPISVVDDKINFEIEVNFEKAGNKEILAEVALSYIPQGQSSIRRAYNVVAGSGLGWFYKDKVIELKNVGIKHQGTPNEGDKITQKLIEYINTSQSLMPSKYRDTKGVERFYNATNDTYEGVTFNNPFVAGKPKEHIFKVEDIKPSIEGMLVNGQRIDMFEAFAYDEDDNDETYQDDDGNVYFKHPYFFAKLKPLGFNLFDHAIEQQPMTISFTSGACGACNFEIAVDEESQKNTVQVDDNGNVIYDENGRVLCGAEGSGQNEVQPQDVQQDTTNHSVWIALQKEESTYGILMPKAPENGVGEHRPTTDDTFVILGINLPNEYILNAERRLEAEIIKYLQDNNDEKFTFSIGFSRIYFAENEDVLNSLNENSKIQITYDNKTYDLYVSSFSYTMSESDALPEIKVELDETLKTSQNAIQKAINEVKTTLGSAINEVSQGVAMQRRSYVSKVQDDTAMGVVDFSKGVKFGEGGKVEILDNNSAKLTIEYLEVTKKATFTSLEIQEKTHVGGQMLVTPASMNCGEVEEFEGFYRCYFQTKGADGSEEIFNQFVVGDQAICQTFNAWGSKYYWRLVVGVGEDYVDLSKEDCDEGSGAPEAGDRIIQMGNREDEARQNAIVIAAHGDNSPYIVQYKGINNFDLPKTDNDPRITTLLSPTKNILTGTVKMQAGSEGLENFEAWTQLKDEVDSKVSIEDISGYEYLVESLQQPTEVLGGLILTSNIQLRDSDGSIKSGINGIYMPNALGGGIAAWYGGVMEEGVANAIIRFDGSGYFAKGNLSWDNKGGASFADGKITITPQGALIFSDDIAFGSNENETVASIIQGLSTVLSYFTLDDAKTTLTSEYNLVIEGDVASGGDGQDTPGGSGGVSEEDVLDILEKNNYITSAALSSYYTKGESDARYLALSGGTIGNGSSYLPLKVVGTSTRASIGFSKDGSAFGYLTYNGGSSWAVTNEYYNTEYTLIHSGNIGSYALPIGGGTISGTVAISGNSITNAPLNIVTPSMGYTGYIRFGAGIDTNELGYLGFSAKGVPAINYGGVVNTLIHSGNIGSYALPISGGNLTGRLVAQAGLSSWQGADFFSSERLALNLNSNNAYGVYAALQQSDVTKFMLGYSPVLGAAWFENANGYGFYLSDNGNVLIGTTTDNSAKLQVNGNIDSFSDGEYSGVIGFNRKSAVGGRYNTAYAGWQIHNHLGTLEFFCEPASGSDGMRMAINENGNVTIGGSDLAGTSARLSVDGSFTMWGAYQNVMPTLGDFTNARFKLYGYGNRTTQNWGLFAAAMNSGNAYLQVGGDFGDTLAYNLLLNPLGGSVGIGTTDLYDANKLRLVNTHPHQHTWSLGYLAQESDFSVEFKDTFGGGVYGLYTSINYYTGYVAMQVGRSDGLTNAYGLMLQPLGGNILIGTAIDSGYKLDVNGEVRATTFRFYDNYRSRITLNGSYIDIISAGDEMCIGTNSGDTTMYINYRNSTGAGTVKAYRWNAGSSSSWADFYMGNTTINGNLVVSGDVASA